jgi:hypothetical protein
MMLNLFFCPLPAPLSPYQQDASHCTRHCAAVHHTRNTYPKQEQKPEEQEEGKELRAPKCSAFPAALLCIVTTR